jgi:hypothetical protein
MSSSMKLQNIYEGASDVRHHSAYSITLLSILGSNTFKLTPSLSIDRDHSDFERNH